MSDEGRFGIETGLHLEGSGPMTWRYALVVYGASDLRTLYAVRPSGAVIIDDALTLDEARGVLREIGPTLARLAPREDA